MKVAMLTTLCFLTMLGAIGLTHAECPSYWTRFRQHCYRFFGSHKMWSDAEAHCNSFSSNAHSDEEKISHLVSIQNQAQNNFIYGLWSSSRETPGNESLLWIGLYKPRGRNYFTWSDNSNDGFTNWHPDRPNNYGGNEDCAEMWEKEIENLRLTTWNDRPCVNKASYMCKMQYE